MRVLVFCYAAVGCGGVIVCVWWKWVWDGVVFLPMGMDGVHSNPLCCVVSAVGLQGLALVDQGHLRCSDAEHVFQ